MKPCLFAVFSLPLFFSLPAMALDATSCSAKSAQLKPSERNAYMKSCLTQVSSPANIKEIELRHKKTLCEQNAKNNRLQGDDKVKYLDVCMNKNEAAEAAANSVPAGTSEKMGSPQEKFRNKSARPAPPPAIADENAKPKNKLKRKAKVLRDGDREMAK